MTKLLKHPIANLHAFELLLGLILLTTAISIILTMILVVLLNQFKPYLIETFIL